MSPRKILIICSPLFWVAFTACRDEAPAVGKTATIDFFSEENTPGLFSKPDIFELQLKEPVIRYSSAITTDVIPMGELTFDDPALKEKLIYYGTTGVRDMGDGTWEVLFSKYCHYVKGVARDFARLAVVKSASTLSTGMGLLNWSPMKRENGHNYFAPTLRISFEDGQRDFCFANAFYRINVFPFSGTMEYFMYSHSATAAAYTRCYYLGESERPGTYDIEVGLDGYETQHVKNITIVLDENQCHVVKKEIEVTLKKK